MNIENACKYVKCSDCYKAPRKRTRRSTSGARKKFRKGACNHTILQPYDDTKYFISPFDDLYDDEVTWPKICVNFKGKIVVVKGV